jgi:hypothetical protein
MELTVAGTALTETHLLHICHHTLHLVVARLESFLQQALRLIVLHADDTDKGLVVTGFSPTLAVSNGQLVCLFGIVLCRVHITVMGGIRKGIQLVHSVSVRT